MKTGDDLTVRASLRLAAALGAVVMIGGLQAVADEQAADELSPGEPPTDEPVADPAVTTAVEPTAAESNALAQVALFPFEVSESVSVEQAEFLTTQVFKTFEARLGERYNIVKVEIRAGDSGSIYEYSDICDRACMLEKSTAAGMRYAVTTESRPFGEGLAVTLELLETESGRIVESASGGCDGSAGELIGTVNESVDKLIVALERISDTQAVAGEDATAPGVKAALPAVPPKPGAGRVAAGWVMFALFDIAGGTFYGLYFEDGANGFLVGGIGCSVVSLISLFTAISGHVANAEAAAEWQRQRADAFARSRRTALSVSPWLSTGRDSAGLVLVARF